MDIKEKREKQERRRKRVRAKIFGTAKIPRLSVFRSAKHIYAQLIDDERGKTLISANDMELKLKTEKEEVKTTTEKLKTEKAIMTKKVNMAFEVGKLLAKKALEKKIEKVVFDKRGYKYHGRVKALAEGAREAGLKF